MPFPYYCRRVLFTRGSYIVEFYVDMTCLMVGVNYNCFHDKWSAYIHVGPFILGWYDAGR
jgi:hypothetical protein